MLCFLGDLQNDLNSCRKTWLSPWWVKLTSLDIWQPPWLASSPPSAWEENQVCVSSVGRSFRVFISKYVVGSWFKKYRYNVVSIFICLILIIPFSFNSRNNNDIILWSTLFEYPLFLCRTCSRCCVLFRNLTEVYCISCCITVVMTCCESLVKNWYHRALVLSLSVAILRIKKEVRW